MRIRTFEFGGAKTHSEYILLYPANVKTAEPIRPKFCV